MTADSPFIPENPLEEAIVEAKAGRMTTEEMWRWVMNSTVLVASLKAMTEEDPQFLPLLMGSADAPHIAIFTAPSRQALHGEQAPHVLAMLGGEFIIRTPPRYGVIINPGFETQIVLPPYEIDGLKAKLQYGQL